MFELAHRFLHVVERRGIVNHFSKRIEGRKGYREINPELVREAKRLRHGNRKERLSLRRISARLEELGYMTAAGRPLSAAQVKRLLAT